MVLVDSNVLLDIFTEDRSWYEWSLDAVAEQAADGIAINPIIYAEVAFRFDNIEELEHVLPHEYFQRLPLPWEASFLAAKTHAKYRKRGGQKTSTLPDFFIGAHAAIAKLPLITRDASRYRTYFPTLELIAPE